MTLIARGLWLLCKGDSDHRRLPGAEVTGGGGGLHILGGLALTRRGGGGGD